MPTIPRPEVRKGKDFAKGRFLHMFPLFHTCFRVFPGAFWGFSLAPDLGWLQPPEIRRERPGGRSPRNPRIGIGGGPPKRKQLLTLH